MKHFKTMVGALSLCLMASCSNDEPNNAGSIGNGEILEGGYIALQLNLPQELAASRAENGNVDFNDGEAWEYNVANAQLYIFATGTPNAAEGTAKFVEAVTLTPNFSNTPEDDDQITASQLTAGQVKEVGSEDYLWALVVLNKPDNLPLPGELETFSTYLEKIVSTPFVNTLGGKKCIFMTNAPLSTQSGGGYNPTSNGGTIRTLVPLGQAKNAIYSTLQEAKDNKAGCIYVERGVAKVTTTADAVKFEGLTSYNPDNEDGDDWQGNSGIKTEIKVALGNVNDQSYVVRNVNGLKWDLIAGNSSNYRMVGENSMPALYDPLHQNKPNRYRTYWCVDPNYDSELAQHNTSGEFVSVKDAAFYPYENTFPVANMNYANTTLLLLEVTFTLTGGDGNLYILNDNSHVVYKTQFEVASRAHAFLVAQPAIQNAMTKAIKDGAPAFDESDNIADLVYIEFTDPDPTTGVITARRIGLQDDLKLADIFNKYFDETSYDKFKAAIAGDAEKLLDRINANYEIKKYVGGKSYYEIPIMHFGDATTPWTANGTTSQMTVNSAYGPASDQRTNDYLGRYGLVRNNWYELNIKSFKQLGSPVPSNLTIKTSDDNNDIKKYIGVELHILSWAKRVQNVEF